MSKKHFIALADHIKDSQGTPYEFTVGQVQYLAEFCHQQNMRFNRSRWLAYIGGLCGPNGGKVKAARS